MDLISKLNEVIWHQYVLFIVMGTGILFTFWSVFCQYRALTHGTQVVRGVYDDKDDPGAINHFQALSAALSATVGLGNIGGVALAIGLGGPGAVFWMWMIGLAGMALKTTEVTLSMIYRNTDDPENPHGGPMFVAKKALGDAAAKGDKRMGMIAGVAFASVSIGFALLWYFAVDKSFVAVGAGVVAGAVFLGLGISSTAALGSFIGGVFCITLLVSTITGGNMFQAWNVADLTKTYFQVPQVATGIVLSIIVAMVIIGGIKRIGNVAGRIVPIMCLLYLAAAIYVLFVKIGDIPGVFGLIFSSAFSSAEAEGAFIGGTAGYAFLWGMKRALFSSEAGQGSSPIAHSAAKTDEPVREGVVAGLEPFIDTLVVCTLTSLVILSSGIWNRSADVPFETTPIVTQAVDESGQSIANTWTLTPTPLASTEGGIDGVIAIMSADANQEAGTNLHQLNGEITTDDSGALMVEWGNITTKDGAAPALASEGMFFNYKGASLTAKAFDKATTSDLGMWLVTLAAWLFAISTMISWSYYGEQGMVYLLGDKSVLPYKLVYCILIVVATVPSLIKTDKQLDTLTAFGTGVMLWANIPIMLIFGYVAMRTYKDYFRRMKSGEMEGPHKPPPITEVVEGHDVE